MKSHLILCIHGLGGSASDFDCLSQSISNYFLKQKYLVSKFVDIQTHSLKCNEKKLTHVGLELMGKRMALEMEQWLLDNYPVQKEKIIFTVLCHSLGGLVARYGFKEMFFGDKKEFFRSRLHCGSFVTMCTPHLGTRHPGGGKHVNMIGKSLFRTGARFACKNFMGKTGLELYLKDSSSIENTILYRMTAPDSDFMKALQMFELHTLIGSTRHDHIVPYCSATIRSHNPHPKPPKSRPSKCRVASHSGFKDKEKNLEKILHFLGHNDYIVETLPEFTISNSTNPYCGKRQRSGWYRDNLRHFKFDPTMMKNLQTISWRRLSFEFQLPSVFNHTNAHCLCLGSWFTGTREDMTTAGIDAVRLIMMLVFMDHIHLVKRYYGIELRNDVHLEDESSMSSCSDEEILTERVQRRNESIISMNNLMVMPQHPLESNFEEYEGLESIESSDMDSTDGGVDSMEGLYGLNILDSNSESSDYESVRSRKVFV